MYQDWSTNRSTPAYVLRIHRQDSQSFSFAKFIFGLSNLFVSRSLALSSMLNIWFMVRTKLIPVVSVLSTFEALF